MATQGAVVHFDLKNLVLYVCSCTQPVPLEELYFCRHCKVPRCSDCVSTVVDGTCIFCPHCFENVPQAEAKTKRNCCSHCFRCPFCASSLNTRYVIVQTDRDASGGSPSPPTPRKGETTEDQSSLRTPPRTGRASQLRGGHSAGSLRSPGGTKYYYLTCTNCRWTTRDVGIKDKRSPLDFKDQLHPHQDRITYLISYYKDVEIREKMEREQSRKVHGRRSRAYSGLVDSSRLRSLMIGEKTLTSSDKKGTSKWDKVPSVASDPEPLPDHFYEPLDISKSTSLSQRYLAPARQPSYINELWPRPLQLRGKKLHRCKGCDHILLKAEINPSSIRFKIQQIAMNCFPRIRLLSFPKLKLNEPSQVLLSFTNPVSHQITLTFSHCREATVKRTKERISHCDIPEGSFSLTTCDDVSDILSEGDSKLEDNPAFVHTRQPGKVILRFSTTATTYDVDTKIMFMVKFTYKPLIQVEGESDHIFIEAPVLINCGHQPA